MDILDEVVKTLIQISVSKYIAAFMIILIALIFNRYVITRIFDYIIRLAKRTKNLADDSLAWSLEKPVKPNSLAMQLIPIITIKSLITIETKGNTISFFFSLLYKKEFSKVKL